MKKFVFMLSSLLFLSSQVSAFEVSKLISNKEAFSRELLRRDHNIAESWKYHHRLGQELKPTVIGTLIYVFTFLEKSNSSCELGLASVLQDAAVKNGVINPDEDLLNLSIYLRHENLIDDILFKILKSTISLKAELAKNLNRSTPVRPVNLNTAQNSGIDLKKFYAPVSSKWPDDLSNCSLDAYWEMFSTLKWKNNSDRDIQILKLNYLAVKDGVINLQTYNKLETFRKTAALDWPVYYKRYLDIVVNAKDKLAKKVEEKTENDFSVEYVSRRDKLTQRGSLYQRYDSTQIMMLAQIIEKAAKRMDARLASINWQYTDDPKGEGEIYVLSPMEQYRAAVKMLRKDMAEVMRSEAFGSVGLGYQDLIAAAFETGYIKSSEIDQVLKFEEFWNPKVPKWKAYMNFAFSLGGTASFYLPPPWNILGAIGLVLTQAQLNGAPKPDSDDNWNVII